MNMCSIKYFLFLLSLNLLNLCTAYEPTLLRRIKDCLSQDGPIVCLKERALDTLNETIMSEKPLSLYGVVDIIKDPDYVANSTDEVLPRDLKERSTALNDLLYDKVEEFFESRSLKINLGNMFEEEGRGKKDKKGGMMMMGGIALAGMMAQMFMGKIAFMAGAALLVAKLALLLSTVIGFKKLSGGSSGGESSHVVYASGGGGDSGYSGHSHGGWHRSIAGEEAQQNNNPYRAHAAQNEVVDTYNY